MLLTCSYPIYCFKNKLIIISCAVYWWNLGRENQREEKVFWVSWVAQKRKGLRKRRRRHAGVIAASTEGSVEEQQRIRVSTDAKGGLRTAWACQCLAPSSWDACSGGKDLTVQTYLKCRNCLAKKLPMLSIETLALSPPRENSWTEFYSVVFNIAPDKRCHAASCLQPR